MAAEGGSLVVVDLEAVRHLEAEPAAWHGQLLIIGPVCVEQLGGRGEGGGDRSVVTCMSE